MNDNLIAPLEFDDGRIDQFLARHVCALCRGYLVKFPGSGRNWIAKCPVHGVIMRHNYIRRGQKARTEQQIIAALRELRERANQTETETIHQLGF